MTVISLLALFAVPTFANEYWLQAILIPFLIFALAALGLNLLTGFAGQLSLGTGGFMAVGAYSAFKMTTAWPGMDIIAIFFISGFFAAGVGILFGLPSLRIKGFYLAVATLAAQFFLIWLFNRVPWFYNDNPSGTITAPPRKFAGVMVTGPEATAEVRYLVALVLLALFVFLARNLMRSRFGRAWMAVRDMDVAAEIVGIPLLRTKLLAFGVSSYLCGVAGALFVFLYLGSAETIAFDVNVSFLVLFMIIVGGLGSIAGSIIGAAFITDPADLPHQPEPDPRHRPCRRPRQAHRGHHLRWPHHRDPDPRAARHGAPHPDLTRAPPNLARLSRHGDGLHGPAAAAVRSVGEA